jgi:8-oxo-dGTP pyrophosphatase MutT (NUDIX family)
MDKLPLGKVAASAAVIQDSKLLLLQRADGVKWYPNHWTFPSGGIEETDADVRAALLREVKEETGLDFICTKAFGFYESHAGGKRHFALVHIGAGVGKIKIQESEVKAYRWVTYTEAKDLPLAFAYEDVINDLYQRRFIK